MQGTNQSLQADTELFLAIVDICAEICKDKNITFHRGAWVALWKCIVQSVQCLTFEEYDLASARHGFTHVLSLGDKGSPIVDRWIEQKLTSEAPNYIPIWRRLINNWCNLSRKKTEKWSEVLPKFQSSFESAAATTDDVYSCLSEICNQINWKGIPFLPSPEDLASIDDSIRPRARNGVAAAIRNGPSALKKLDADTDEIRKEYAVQNKESSNTQFKYFWIEWLLVQ